MKKNSEVPSAKKLKEVQSITITENVLHDLKKSEKYEWLETNGLGGFASSSVINLNTRRYHGLLVSAIKPPAERMLILSKLDETIVVHDKKYELGCNDYGTVINPNGNQYMQSFTKNLFPEFIYEAGGIRLKKTIAMKHGENTTLLLYEVLKAESEFTFELLPLIAVRDYHSLAHSNGSIDRQAVLENSMLKIHAYENTPEFFIHVPGAEFIPQPDWYFHFNYSEEKTRGLDFEEDLFTYGKFSVKLQEGDRLGIIVSMENPSSRNAFELFGEEKSRRENILKGVEDDSSLKTLALAADQFIVKRGEDLKTIIAGYHWFTDWGRDTMIALPGLCLSPGRFDDAKKILAAFAASVSMGMLPNRFQDRGEEPEYNNVDGTLWYFIAVYRYLLASGDKKFVLHEILPVLKDIIDWHYKGTRYNIHADEDGLLYAGEAGVQLTWMDAKVGDWVVTPRIGKPVEVNALWYNALRIFSELLKMNDEKREAKLYREKAKQIQKRFSEVFWSDEHGFLFDVVNGENKDATLRPNQLFALGLIFPLIVDEKAEKILSVVKEKLYTPVGLRSLSPDDANYKAHYGGDPLERDGSYHQGTVWSWLLGVYIDAMVNTKGKSARKECREIIERFRHHLAQAGIGTVSEIFDGDAPHEPRGCIAQAWSVGELIRVMVDHKLVKRGSSIGKKQERKKSSKKKAPKETGEPSTGHQDQGRVSSAAQ